MPTQGPHSVRLRAGAGTRLGDAGYGSAITEVCAAGTRALMRYAAGVFAGCDVLVRLAGRGNVASCHRGRPRVQRWYLFLACS